MQLHLDHRFSFRSCDGVVVMDPGRDGERVAEMGRALLPGTTWHATRLMSWIPHLRQFQVAARRGEANVCRRECRHKSSFPTYQFLAIVTSEVLTCAVIVVSTRRRWRTSGQMGLRSICRVRVPQTPCDRC